MQTKLACLYDEHHVFTETNNGRSGSVMHVNEEVTVVEFNFEYFVSFFDYYWSSLELQISKIT